VILLDHSESSLFTIEQKLKQMNSNIKIITKLINLSDKNLLDNCFSTYNIDMVYHAAAYKHVNMLENNILSGVKNNIIGLYYLLNVCEKNNVKNFILISTDKAVKPTTIMGMTKKFCELMVFNFGSRKGCVYSAVRFGNVFDSSGSVVPIFKKQILEQNYITVTDKDVTRYFMSIDEAVHLVIRASLMSKGNEMFILDMGEPRKILDIAKKMIHISGNTIKSEDNPNGDIEIKIVGLGKNEKLHEELSEYSVEKTSQEKILKSQDSQIEFNNLDEKIKLLLEYINNKDEDAVNDYLKNNCFK
jgi:FlaA1/EpsC-like NDP-sugar epimerase